MTVYEVMRHNYGHGVREKGVATLLHPVGEGAFALRYHQTDVVVAYRDGSVTLDSGGWSQTCSPTTKGRISRYLPEGFSMYQKKKVWWVVQPNGQEVEFEDGMILQTDRVVTTQGPGMLVGYSALDPFSGVN